jgi:hypothetical protein
MEEGQDFFRLIFYDFSFCFIDACFSSDSKAILTIPSKYPSFIFMLSLPLVTVKQPRKTGTANSNGPSLSQQSLAYLTSDGQGQKQNLINFEARKAGPLTIIGPAKGIFGQPLKMTHITCNTNQTTGNTDYEYYHFVTWNDGGLGEYCLWKLKDTSYEWFPRLVVPRADKSWLEVR